MDRRHVCKGERPHRDMVKDLLKQRKWDTILRLFGERPYLIWSVRDARGETALHRAIDDGKLDFLRSIVVILEGLEDEKEKRRAFSRTFNSRDAVRGNLTNYAARKGNLKIFKLVYGHQTRSPNCILDNELIYNAILSGSITLVHYLSTLPFRKPGKLRRLWCKNFPPYWLEKSSSNLVGYTSIDAAIQSGNDEMLQFILSRSNIPTDMFSGPHGESFGKNLRTCLRAIWYVFHDNDRELKILQFLKEQGYFSRFTWGSPFLDEEPQFQTQSELFRSLKPKVRELLTPLLWRCEIGSIAEVFSFLQPNCLPHLVMSVVYNETLRRCRKRFTRLTRYQYDDYINICVNNIYKYDD